jgi:putative spermidine/putrescine transport system ATP-binding protein
VQEIEYQGSFVVVSLKAADGQELTATIAEKAFYAAPFGLGDAVTVSWDPANEHSLTN